MRYVSTRGGIASARLLRRRGRGPGARRRPLRSGGASRPLRPSWRRFRSLPYAELCFRFLERFATDIPEAELGAAGRALLRRVRPAGGRRPCSAPRGRAPRARALPRPDAGLQGRRPPAARQPLRPPVRASAARRSTSSAPPRATPGAAAIHGLMGQPGAAIFILYPDGRVSPLQERQMACTGRRRTCTPWRSTARLTTPRRC